MEGVIGMAGTDVTVVLSAVIFLQVAVVLRQHLLHHLLQPYPTVPTFPAPLH
jgi:hypothetical protein